jgi:hypothetical protein
MKKHESMFGLAAETAANSPFHMAHGAVLVRSGVVLATASNHLGGNKLSPACPSTHAEVATLARFFGGSVKQCFEKSSEALYGVEKRRCKSGFDPPMPSQRVTRQRQQRVRQTTTFDSRKESCVKRGEWKIKGVKRKDTSSGKVKALRLRD